MNIESKKSGHKLTQIYVIEKKGQNNTIQDSFFQEYFHLILSYLKLLVGIFMVVCKKYLISVLCVILQSEV